MNLTSTDLPELNARIDLNAILGRIYHEPEIHLLTAEYKDAQIRGVFRWFTPTCYKKDPTHLTRIQIVTYVGQLAYLFGALMARDGFLPISENCYLERIEADKATFMELKLRFRRFVSPGPYVEVRLQSRRRSNGSPVVKHIGKLVVSPFLFELAQGACVGESEAVVIL